MTEVAWLVKKSKSYKCRVFMMFVFVFARTASKFEMICILQLFQFPNSTAPLPSFMTHIFAII